MFFTVDTNCDVACYGAYFTLEWILLVSSSSSSWQVHLADQWKDFRSLSLTYVTVEADNATVAIPVESTDSSAFSTLRGRFR